VIKGTIRIVTHLISLVCFKERHSRAHLGEKPKGVNRENIKNPIPRVLVENLIE